MPSEISIVYNYLNQVEREETSLSDVIAAMRAAVTQINSSSEEDCFMDSFI